MNKSTAISRSAMERPEAFIWQHLWLLVSLFIMTLGVALCLRSALGSSVISTIPYVMTLAGETGSAPEWTIGEYTYLMNFILVGIQILILRRQFEWIQLLQLIIGFLFGFLLDVNMMMTAVFADTNSMLAKIGLQLAGCVVLGFGITLELRCGSVTMPGEGVPAALNKAFGWQFAKAKIVVDMALVAIAVMLGFTFFGRWLWQVVGPGTLMAMVFVGALVRFFNPRTKWFDRILDYKPGVGRYVFGLAKTMLNKYT